MSRLTAIRFALRYVTNAPPMSCATASFTSAGYVPRMSYTLKMFGFTTFTSGHASLLALADTVRHRAKAGRGG